MSTPRLLKRIWPDIEKYTQIAIRTALHSTVQICTLPYYRSFQFNTMGPVVRMADASQAGHTPTLLQLMSRWRSRKLMELQFVSLASTVLAGAVIGSFSWFSVPSAYWLALAMWYSSLVLSILGIVLSAQQMAILNLLGELPERSASKTVLETLKRYLPLMLSRQGLHENEREFQAGSDEAGVWKPRWKMVFTWQCATMFLSYSLILFLMGLTILVCTPLIRGGDWSSDKNICVVYLVIAGVSGLCFLTCSFWIYHHVDLDHDIEVSEDKEDVAIDIPVPQFGRSRRMSVPQQNQEEPSDTGSYSRRKAREL
ncbi:hypothetical protein EV356DRAFT_563961 [Viridothelium virens]|uniref:Uncharacterized protein n=1 Tax=Viridothelium virens TaxID=1048519 RepID=A0A6A6HK85_VIRVR|nr:hypothetical protein EV356DRAFT_563961 [Viridothelium virens]